MSLLRSWLPQALADKDVRSVLPRYEHELDPWTMSSRGTSPMAQSMVPPEPVAASIRQTTTHLRRNREMPEGSLALQRQERQLQDSLQDLLDAQAEGLIAGLGNELPDDQFSTGSSTPTATRASSRSRTSPARPRGRKIGLRGARRAIWRAMTELATIKEEQHRILETDGSDNRAVLGMIKQWETKREGLRTEIDKIEHSSEGSRSQSVREEARALATDIDELELRLAQMKAKHRQLTLELESVENAVQSKLSSYKASLSMLESEVHQFLSRPPIDASPSTSRDVPLLSLPPNRRTLTMAKDHWEMQHEDIERSYSQVVTERDALNEGAVVWKEVVAEVTDFENRLRQGLTIMGSRAPDSESDADIRSLIRVMDQTLVSLEEKLDLAERNDWKLLICCIGAELEAFKQGKEILERALASDEPDVEPEQEMQDMSGGEASSPEEENLFQSAIFKGKQPLRPGKQAMAPNDDDPDPELLISHQDTDTE